MRPRFRITSNRPALDARLQQAINRKVTAIGLEVHHTLLNEVLVGTRSGRTYRVPGTQRTYQASQPGEAPATRLGDLRRSYKVGRVQAAGWNTTIQVGSTIAYAPALEFGTSSMPARPHLAPATNLALPRILAELATRDWGI